jgi:hypothetical protein
MSAMTRQRYITMTAGAGLIGAVSAIFLVKAPVIPALLGVAIAMVMLLWRAPAE